ncbi:uncharacterized protein LOC100679424 isoform X2 [Nasonia vitripennis]|uniref:Uncharacterized protein n=1 Tax=Nasonia vitripennis TaxID=7425 RepID=A0A7M7LUJ3_NASVI|nr:uncharacterized protein LOC100679424 isoform X2 [Nasonia vitripennis]
MMDHEVKAEVKTEVLSPPSTGSFRSSPDGPTSTKKLDPIDKWRSRVLFCGRTSHGDEEESWSKKIEKQIAVLRVAFPFLTERQIQGKAWQSCGLNSVMGGVPRHGLSQGVKKEFMKHKNPYRCTMSQGSKVKREPMKIERVDKKFAHCPYTFASPTGQLLTPQSIIETLTSQNDLVVNPFSQSQEKNSSPTSGDDLPPSRSAMKRKRRTNKKATNLECNKSVSTTQGQDVIPETPTNSIRSTSPFCSQPLNPQVAAGLDEIIPSLAARSNYFTQAHISECSSTVQSNKEKTQSGLDQGFPKYSQVDYRFIKAQEPEEASVPPTMRTPEYFFVTPKNQIQRDIDGSQIDSDPTVSGLNNVSAERNPNSTNYFCSNMTPNRNTEILDAKKKIIFETVAEVYYSDSYVPGNKNKMALMHLINQNLQGEDIIRAASPTENIENPQMYTPKTLHRTQQETIRRRTFSIDADTNVDHANQMTINPVNNDSLINTNPSRVTNASFHLSEKVSV